MTAFFHQGKTLSKGLAASENRMVKLPQQRAAAFLKWTRTNVLGPPIFLSAVFILNIYR